MIWASWSLWVAVTASALAVALGVRPSPGGVLRKRARLGSSPSRLPTGRLRLDTGPTLRLGVAGLGCGTAWLTLQGRASFVVLAFVAVFVGWSVLTLRARGVRARRRRRRQTEMIELCDSLAADLDTGSPPATALHNAAEDWPVLEPAATAARLGGDVATALREAASTPGCGALSHLGAAWEVSTRSGAALSTTLERMATTLRDDQDARREVTASLGSPRATARLLAVLPLFGLALGAGMGGDPWSVLTRTLLGAICLAVGAVLAVAGVFWVERIADRAEEPP